MHKWKPAVIEMLNRNHTSAVKRTKRSITYGTVNTERGIFWVTRCSWPRKDPVRLLQTSDLVRYRAAEQHGETLNPISLPADEPHAVSKGAEWVDYCKETYYNLQSLAKCISHSIKAAISSWSVIHKKTITWK